MESSAQRPVSSSFRVDLNGGQLAHRYAGLLLESLGITSHQTVSSLGGDCDDIDAARDWAESGLMWLTGNPGDPPARTSQVIPSCARGALIALEALAELNCPEPLDGGALLAERSALLGYTRRGQISANGSCHLLGADGGVIALNLARAEDWDLLPAWLETTATISNWVGLASLVAKRHAGSLVVRGRLLGLPVASYSPGEGEATTTPPWYRVCANGRTGTSRRGQQRPLVVDLSALWAGPLCSHLLLAAGARVIKVESRTRPDSSRSAAPVFFNLLNAGKDSVLVDLHSAPGREQLAQLLAAADIVIESSRPRALRQLGIDAQAIVDRQPGKIWLSLTGYGRTEPRGNWVAFGDDAAIAAGVVVEGIEGADVLPSFCGDALCDPLTGLHAAVAAMAFWRLGDGGLLDINLHDVAAACRGFYNCDDTGHVERQEHNHPWHLEIAGRKFAVLAPESRKPGAAATPPGADTNRVFREYAIPC